MKKQWCWMSLTLCVLCLMLGTGKAAGETAEAAPAFYEEMPVALRFTQETVTKTLEDDVTLRVTYPDTVNDAVDAQMRALLDDMAEQCTQALGLGKRATNLEVGAVISRSGTSVLSFLALAETVEEKLQVGVAHETRVYDMDTGARLTLEDVLVSDSDVWTTLADAVRTQLSAAFPDEAPDAQALAQLCGTESLKRAGFTLGAARLTLTYRADAVYPGKNTLLHVYVPYADIRASMTEYGRQQTDNSRFRMVALTFDDGPAGKYTQRVLDVLREYGAQATFFVVGRNVPKHRELVARQQDSMYSVQSHSYRHKYPKDLTTEIAFEEKAQLIADLSEITGVVPSLMRAPGGSEDFYIKREIGYPLIHWAFTSIDSGSDAVDKIARRVIRLSEDGDIVLMHDLNPVCYKYARKIMEDFCQRGILCVTVEELFLDAGLTMEPNKVYYSVTRSLEEANAQQ